jgi:hypothetical protein
MPPPDADDLRLLESIPLPDGVTPEAWAEEKIYWQNPRIRALLGCSAILEPVYESNQAILNCSPERLAEIWAAVRKVARLVTDEVIPLLERPSVIPRLEEARTRTRLAGGVLASTLIEEIERMPERIEAERSKEFRKLLCVSLGQLHDFLQDAFAELMANDPRSFHDSGYFLSRRFRRDVEEAEWLLATVDALALRLDELEHRRQRDLAAVREGLGRMAALPGDGALEATSVLFHDLVNDLTPRLKEAVALRGIRFAELEVVDRWAIELPARCRVLLELLDLTESARRDGAPPAPRWEEAVLERTRDQLGELDGLLKDLRAFLPLWRQGIGNRRALSFRRLDAADEAARGDA